MKFVLWVPHTSNIIPASRCNSSVDAKRLGDGSQPLLSTAWHWGRADWTLGFWLLLNLSLGLGWSNAGWPGHYLRECACLSKSPCSRPSKLFPRRKYVLLAWMGLFLPFAWQDLGREFLGSLKLLLATTGEAWRWASKTYFLTGAKQ